MVIPILIVLGIIAVVFLVMRGRKRPKITEEERVQAFRAAHERERQERRARHLAAWLPIIETMPIVDQSTTPLLHTPIYDCISDVFELPCAHSSYDSSYSQSYIGMPFGCVSQAELRQTLMNFSDKSPDAVAFVDMDGSAYLLYTETLLEPGSKVQRYVRVGPDAYRAYGWRSGMNARAGKDDPTYFVRDIAARPHLWRERMSRLREAWLLNSSYTYALNQCAHRQAGHYGTT